MDSERLSMYYQRIRTGTDSEAREAFDAVMSLVLRQAQRAAHHMIRTPEDAKDIALIVLVEVWEKRRTLPEGMSGSDFITRFLTSIAKRRTLDQLRTDLRRHRIAEFLSYDGEAVDFHRSVPHLGDVVIAVVDRDREREKKKPSSRAN